MKVKKEAIKRKESGGGEEKRWGLAVEAKLSFL